MWEIVNGAPRLFYATIRTANKCPTPAWNDEVLVIHVLGRRIESCADIIEHMSERVARLEQAITEAVKLASPSLQQVINDLRALRGIADCNHRSRVGPGVPL